MCSFETKIIMRSCNCALRFALSLIPWSFLVLLFFLTFASDAAWRPQWTMGQRNNDKIHQQFIWQRDRPSKKQLIQVMNSWIHVCFLYYRWNGLKFHLKCKMKMTNFSNDFGVCNSLCATVRMTARRRYTQAVYEWNHFFCFVFFSLKIAVFVFVIAKRDEKDINYSNTLEIERFIDFFVFVDFKRFFSDGVALTCQAKYGLRKSAFRIPFVQPSEKCMRNYLCVWKLIQRVCKCVDKIYIINQLIKRPRCMTKSPL